MASIDDLIGNHFRSIGAGVDPRIDVAELDIGLLHAGKMAETIYDQVIHPVGDLDEEAVAASAKALLALLGQLGCLVDALESYVRTAATPGPAAQAH